jgi:signal transduction histidine kinase
MIWSRRVTQPIIRLHDATKEVGKGKFDIRVNPTSSDEIGDLALSFNQMTQELTSREEALKQTQAQLVQSEKLAAFGQLGAGIAHEVKNPLAGILGYVQLSMRKVGPETPLHVNLKIIEKETKRCKTIIDNLLKFTRQEVVDRKPIEVNGVIEDTSALVEHQLGMHQIRLEKSLAEGLLPILGNANQLQQVLLNIILNAQQAMEGKPGVVRLETEILDEGWIEVRVRDTGPGIPKEIQSRLFDPFFTTKPAGKGTGLGLSVSYGIVRDHEGEIQVESEPGEGALFRIRLPALRPGESAGNGSRRGRPEEVAHA